MATRDGGLRDGGFRDGRCKGHDGEVMWSTRAQTWRFNSSKHDTCSNDAALGCCLESGRSV
jgi:hypothetical protein